MFKKEIKQDKANLILYQVPRNQVSAEMLGKNQVGNQEIKFVLAPRASAAKLLADEGLIPYIQPRFGESRSGRAG